MRKVPDGVQNRMWFNRCDVPKGDRSRVVGLEEGSLLGVGLGEQRRGRDVEVAQGDLCRPDTRKKVQKDYVFLPFLCGSALDGRLALVL